MCHSVNHSWHGWRCILWILQDLWHTFLGSIKGKPWRKCVRFIESVLLFVLALPTSFLSPICVIFVSHHLEFNQNTVRNTKRFIQLIKRCPLYFSNWESGHHKTLFFYVYSDERKPGLKHFWCTVPLRKVSPHITKWTECLWSSLWKG